jgi:hypothetical protein
MPVTRICASDAWSANVGAGEWIGRLSAALTGPASSTGSPMTLMAAHETFRGVHGDGAHGVLAEVLGDLEHEPVALVVGLESVQDCRQVVVELHVDDGARDLADATNFACHLRLQQKGF